MSSSICLSMQTCFEPLLMHPRVLGLALFPHVHPSSASPALTRSSPPSDQILPPSLSCWDNAVAVGHVACQDEGLYVHPLIRRSASVLSEKSLEMCTESLGSETGTGGDFLRDDAEIYRFFVTDKCREFPEPKRGRSSRGKSRDFPPPLTSMTGSAVVRMRSCRGEGRLVLQAVSVSTCRNSFLVERGEGRLRLSQFLKEDATDYIGEGQEDKDEEEEEEERIGGGREQQPCRCKDGEGLMNWKTCWVAT